MKALLSIFRQTTLNYPLFHAPSNRTWPNLYKNLQKLQLNTNQSFTTQQFKSALRNSLTAKQIEHLLVKYKSEWYSKLDAEGKQPEWEVLDS